MKIYTKGRRPNVHDTLQIYDVINDFTKFHLAASNIVVAGSLTSFGHDRLIYKQLSLFLS